MAKNPTVGVLLDYEEKGSFSSRPYFALRCSYFDAIDMAGGLPFGIPYKIGSIDQYLLHIDGLLIPGGFYSFPSDLYDGVKKEEKAPHTRYVFEKHLIKRALQIDLPILGICAGMQVLASSQGALLHASIQDELEPIYDHLNEKPAEQFAHPVRITPNTQLHEILKIDRMEVNTAHNEALKTIPKTMTVNALAPDGIVEGIELHTHRFAIGVQWHPEFFLNNDGPNLRLFQAFLSACRN